MANIRNAGKVKPGTECFARKKQVVPDVTIKKLQLPIATTNKCVISQTN